MPKFKIESLTSWAHHRSGWGPCADVLQQLGSPHGAVLLVDSVERLIKHSLLLDEPWVGFVHKAVLAPEHLETVYPGKRDTSLPAMMATDVWRHNIEQCRESVLPVRAPRLVRAAARLVSGGRRSSCHLVRLPRFDFELFRRNEDKKVILIGHWLRRFQSFYDLSAPIFRSGS